MESVDLFVSDALVGVDDAVKCAYPISKHQFCVVHLKKILLLLPHKKKKDIAQEINGVIQEL
ncbi:MAG: hypothetical protein GX921_07230 [Bacteroidales bacterium]|nr:hypothetical protein [Bacteroidales bacterium]